MPQQLFSALEQAVSTSEGKALYILVLICIAMILDFLLGSFAAWRDPQVKFTSQRGIDGILRKLASILVLVCCIPVSALVPAEAGLAALIVLAGSVMEFGLVWSTADVLMGFMALINLPVIIILGGPAIRCMKDYIKQKKAGKDPVFRAADIHLKDKTDFWN